MALILMETTTKPILVFQMFNELKVESSKLKGLKLKEFRAESSKLKAERIKAES